MHCSNCGTQLTQNLNYCQHCGSRNQRKPLVVGSSASNLLICAGGVLGVVGLIVFFAVLRELLHSSISPEGMGAILVAYLATLFLMFAVLIGHAWKNSGDIRIAGSQRAEDEPYASPRSFQGVNTAQLEPMSDVPISVTEHTTRTLSDVPLRR